MKQDLYNIAKCVSGNVLLIGVDDSKIFDIINSNDKVLICNSLNNFKQKKMYCDSTTTSKTKTIKVKKMKKIFKKKKVDFILCNSIEMKKHMKLFLSSSVYINSNMLYMYGNKNEVDYEELIKKYKRYCKDIKIEFKKDDFIIYIDNKNTKTNKIKDIFYYIIDTISNARNLIADIMMG